MFIELVGLVIRPPRVGKKVVRALAGRFTRLYLHVLQFMTYRPISGKSFHPSGRTRYVAAQVGVFQLLVVDGARNHNASVRGLDRIGVVFAINRHAPRTPPILVANGAVRQVFLSVGVRAFSNGGFMVAGARELHSLIGRLAVYRRAKSCFMGVEILPALPRVEVL